MRRGSLKLLTTLVITLLTLQVLLLHLVSSESREGIEGPIIKVLSDLEYLYSKGVKVESLVRQLDEAVKAVERGDYERAEAILSKLESRVEELKANAERTALYNALSKYLAVSAVLSIPILFYLTVPRVYLYVWYKTRRHWLVGEKR